MITFIDLFAGIGGFRLGLERAAREDSSTRGHLPSVDQLNTGRGWNKQPSQDFVCIWSCELDKYCETIYKKNFGEGFNAHDIRAVNSSTIPDFDLLCSGFPCQSFSIAGKRRGFEDTRGTLFFEICRITRIKRPTMLLLENVKGLLSHDEGRTFQTILESLDELGYDCEWEVLNSKNFGVPQNRERVFIVGHLRGSPRFQVFPLGEDAEGIIEGANDASDIRCLQGGGHSEGHHSGMTLISNSLDVDGYLRYGGRVRDGNGKPQLLPIGYRRIRRLTPLECERLQGFPDGWTEGVSDTQRYKMLGNAVTVNVIEAIGQRMIDAKI